MHAACSRPRAAAGHVGQRGAVEPRPDRYPLLRQAVRREALQQGRCGGLDGREAMGPAAGAGPHRPAADQAGPACLPGELSPVCADHIQVVEPSHRLGGLQPHRQLLERRGRQGTGQDGLQPGRGVCYLLVEQGRPQPAPQRRQPLPEREVRQGRTLYRPRHIHGEAQQRPAVCRQQPLLPGDAGLPRVQDLLQGDFPHSSLPENTGPLRACFASQRVWPGAGRCEAGFYASRWATASMNASDSTARAWNPGSTSPTRSLVMIPAFSVSKQARSSLSAKDIRSESPSSSPRLRRAPLQAKTVAMGLVEVFSPFRWR